MKAEIEVNDDQMDVLLIQSLKDTLEGIKSFPIGKEAKKDIKAFNRVIGYYRVYDA